MGKNNIECPNCENLFDENFKYCPACGQKAGDKLTLGVLFSNTISNYFSVDARFFKSFFPLMFKPGYLAEQFVSGKRLLYLHPAQMYLFISVVFFFLFSFITREQTEELNKTLKKTITTENVLVDTIAKKKQDSLEVEKVREIIKTNKFITGFDNIKLDSIVNKEMDSVLKVTDLNKKKNTSILGFNEDKIDSLIAVGAPDAEIYKAMGLNDDAGAFEQKLYHQSLKFYRSRDGGNVLSAFYDTLPIALFVLLPIFALILKILYYRKGVYANHLVFSFYYFSYLFTVFSILVACNLIWKNFPSWIITLIMLSTFLYLNIGVKRFYKQGWFISFIKSSLATFIFMSIIIPLAIVLIGLFAFMFY